MNTIDARGFSCPEPVLMTKQALAQGQPLTVLVDNTTAVGNITRFAENKGYQVACTEAGEDFQLVISK